MAQTKPLLEALKRELKRQGRTYRDVARVLGLSEASVKRLFAEQSFNLGKLDRVCESLGLEISDLVRLMDQAAPRITQLTLDRERELVADVKLLLMAHFLMSRWTFAEIVEQYDIAEAEGIRLLARLDRMGIIALLPGNRVRLMISNAFEWRANGPIERFYRTRVQGEFLDGPFTGAGAYRVFRSGMLTRNSSAEIIDRLQRVAGAFSEACIEDEAFPLTDRSGTSLLIAMRPWGVDVFEALRRPRTADSGAPSP